LGGVYPKARDPPPQRAALGVRREFHAKVRAARDAMRAQAEQVTEREPDIEFEAVEGAPLDPNGAFAAGGNLHLEGIVPSGSVLAMRRGPRQ
jgi:hypothetical protein